jgi:hypothetical protein
MYSSVTHANDTSAARHLAARHTSNMSLIHGDLNDHLILLFTLCSKLTDIRRDMDHGGFT